MGRRPVVARICSKNETDEALADYLDRRGYDVRFAHEEWSAMALLGANDVDVALVDLQLDGLSGTDLLRKFSGGGSTAFVMIGRNCEPVDRILALELGAADFLDAPVVPRELASRLNRLLARRGHPIGDLVMLENSSVDMKAALVMRNSGEEEQLSPGQIALLRLFVGNPGRVLGREDIMAAAPAESFDAFDRSVDSRIVRLRRKLDTESIVTVRGAGYRFDPPV
ncbi:response regulator transcription factor [Aquibium sp. LZ166]|uniref:Response regulator transcription factor n=1 Tax=Aquibium pacificus TaxID=3153579 RepID=A0ABV3SJ76_9HYPH